MVIVATLRELVEQGVLLRSGAGRTGDPFIYSLGQSAPAFLASPPAPTPSGKTSLPWEAFKTLIEGLKKQHPAAAWHLSQAQLIAHQWNKKKGMGTLEIYFESLEPYEYFGPFPENCERVALIDTLLSEKLQAPWKLIVRRRKSSLKEKTSMPEIPPRRKPTPVEQETYQFYHEHLKMLGEKALAEYKKHGLPSEEIEEALEKLLSSLELSNIAPLMGYRYKVEVVKTETCLKTVDIIAGSDEEVKARVDSAEFQISLSEEGWSAPVKTIRLSAIKGKGLI
jgi:hypothetical protein